ncbi:hypothetical protein [Duganella vulcania]|uniref:Phosphoribosylanthranilate isomerase n=1 Tax=Duganella vulcania TaxID=2692166 RepID=A0A845GIH3_9BURK|nr:hypothetical protein [Duganella vulcania]MYM92469.1 hypothetical protein [Duganella vulcania]
MAFEAGCDGVFLISMDGHDEVLLEQAVEVKARWPRHLVGINFLSRPPELAIEACAEAGLDMTWIDNAQVHSQQDIVLARGISAQLQRFVDHQLFGGVAFKYQRHEPNPGLAAMRAQDLGIVSTTTGPGTGQAADVDKIARMYRAIGGGPLAIASGVTPDNVLDYAPYLTHILVATGVSKNEHEFDFELLCRLMGKLNTRYGTHVAETAD